MEEQLKDIWENWKPYYQTDRRKSFILPTCNDLGVNGNCLHLCEAVTGEIYMDEED